MRAKRHCDARNASEIVPDRLKVRAEHLGQLCLQGLSSCRDRPRRDRRGRRTRNLLAHGGPGEGTATRRA